MKTNVIIGIAAGAAIIGLLVGWGIGRSGKAELAERADQQEALMAQVTTLEERLGAIEGRFDGLSQQIESLSTGLQDQSDQMTAMSDEIGQVEQSVSDAMASLYSDISATMSEQLSSLTTQLAAIQAPAQEAEAATGQIVLPGGTLMIGEGAARVFLSSVSADRQSARVAVNGFSLQTLQIGQPIEAGGCEITLTGVEPPAAVIDASCGDEGSQSD
jgi:uncharacterized coiled-coil protein SlyX